MLPPAVGAFAGEPHHASFREHRHDAGDAQLDRLAHGVVHAVAAGDALYQTGGDRRFALDRIERGGPDDDLAAVDPDDVGAILAAAAVEQREQIADVEAQHPHGVVRGRPRQGEFRADRQRLRQVKTGAGTRLPERFQRGFHATILA